MDVRKFKFSGVFAGGILCAAAIIAGCQPNNSGNSATADSETANMETAASANMEAEPAVLANETEPTPDTEEAVSDMDTDNPASNEEDVGSSDYNVGLGTTSPETGNNPPTPSPATP